MSATDGLRAQAAEALRRAGRPADRLCPPTPTPSGETRDIHRASGSYVTLVGTNKLFHVKQDRWPDCVNLDTLTRTAQEAARLVLALSRER